MFFYQKSKVEAARNLWKLYVLALFLIALLITTAFTTAEILNHNAEESAKSLNTAGFQRTLSQRIVIFAQQYVDEQNPSLKNDYRKRLENEKHRFLKNHRALISGDEAMGLTGLAGRVAKDVYFSDPHQLDQQIEEFAALIKTMIQTDSIDIKRDVLNDLEYMALNGLLISLNAVVEEVEAYDLERKNKFILLERISFSFALLLLILEGLLIFRPSQRFITGAIKEIEDLEQQKREIQNLAIKATDLGIWDTNLKTGETYFSDRWFTMLGYEPNELAPNFSTWETLVHPDDKEEAVKIFQDHLDQKTEQYSVEHRLKCKDGSYKWIYSRGLVFDRDDNGDPIRALGSHFDITEQKTAHQEAELFMLLAENAQDGLVITDADGKIEWVNPAFVQMTGYAMSEMIGRKPGSFLQGPDTNPETVKMIRASLLQHKIIDTEIVNYTKNGRSYWIDLFITPLKNDRGEVEKFVAIQRDITEQKLYEDNLKNIIDQKTKDLQNTNDRLETEQHRIKAIMNHVAEGLIVIDKTGSIISFNRGAEQIFGYKTDQVIGENVKILMHDDLKNKHDGYIQHHLETGENKIIGRGREVIGRTIDGRTVPISLSITRLDIEDDTFFIGTTRDITDEKHKQASLEQAIDDAEKANKAKDDFLANMSHELRTPLNSIMGLTNILKQKDYAENDKKSLATISNASESLLRTVNDILDLSKIEAGKVVLEDSDFDVKEFIDNIAAHIKPLSDKKGLEFKGNYSQIQKQYCRADNYRIERILLNILTNAIKYTDAGYVRFDCEMITGDDGHLSMRAVVEDTGIGIPEHKIDQVFEKFTQSDETIERRYGGTGLGLSITKHLVDMMGGEIKVSSQEDIGSTFEVTLPLLPAQKDSAVEKQGENDGAGQQSRLNAKTIDQARILIAEDNEFNIVFIEELLRDLGCHSFKTVLNGKECVEEMKLNSYDLVLMDCHMPTMNGFQAADQIREFNTETPIIAVTADLRLETKLLCDKAGINGYLDKPINQNAFIETVAQFLAVQGDQQAKSAEGDALNKDSVPSSSILNLDILKDYVDGDDDRLKGLVALFIQKSDEDLAAMQGYHDEGDHENWCRLAHKLKGSASYIQAKILERLCQEAQDLPIEQADQRSGMMQDILKAHHDIAQELSQRGYL